MTIDLFLPKIRCLNQQQVRAIFELEMSTEIFKILTLKWDIFINLKEVRSEVFKNFLKPAGTAGPNWSYHCKTNEPQIEIMDMDKF